MFQALGLTLGWGFVLSGVRENVASPAAGYSVARLIGGCEQRRPGRAAGVAAGRSGARLGCGRCGRRRSRQGGNAALHAALGANTPKQ